MQNKIYTSYFANIRKLPEDIIPIAICGKCPPNWIGLSYPKLAPKKSFFWEWKKNNDNNYYIEHFQKEVLNLLNPQETVKELYLLSKNKNIALICYEAPDKFCHRHLVAEWLNKNGFDAEEYK